ncbi:MAG: hypothetical protein WC564_01485 [Patescibacteria group bacterium]|jgi:hypothetical protein
MDTQELITKLLKGNFVRVTTVSTFHDKKEGICKDVFFTPTNEKYFDVVLNNGDRYGIQADVITSNSVEQSGFRKVEVLIMDPASLIVSPSEKADVVELVGEKIKKVILDKDHADRLNNLFKKLTGGNHLVWQDMYSE